MKPIDGRNPRDRRVPELPPTDARIRVIIDTDAGCEVDDQYAIALALLSPERFRIEGFVSQQWGSPDTLDRSVEEIGRVIEKAGMAGRFPVHRGAPPLQWIDVPERAEGVDFIVETALTSDPQDPLWIISLGAISNVASAYLTEPAIADHVRLLWHTRSQWPVRGANFNILGDLNAARRVFSSDLPLVMFDTGTYLRWTMEESEQRIKPHGALGEYLHAIRAALPYARAYEKGFFDLGDVALLVDPSLGEYDAETAPSLGTDSNFEFYRPQGQVLRVHHIDRRGTLDLLCRKLAEGAPSK